MSLDRWGMVVLVTYLFDVTLDQAVKLVDEYIPIEAYTDEGFGIPPDDVMTWAEVIADDVPGLRVVS